MNKDFHLKTFLIYVLVLWIIISVLRFFFNYSKIITDERSYVYSSEEKLRRSFFGINFLLEKELKKSEAKDIYLVDDSGISYHYLRYALHPIKVYRDPKKSFFKQDIELINMDLLIAFADRNNHYSAPAGFMLDKSVSIGNSYAFIFKHK